MNDLQFYALFNNISIISGQCKGDYERLCSVEPRLHLKRFPPTVGIEPGTARSAGRRLTKYAIGAAIMNEGSQSTSEA